MQKVNIKKLAIAGLLIAVGVVCSTISFPVGASKCAPVQHFMNVLCAVVLGPGYGVACAFVTSLLRNLLGTGTLLAFPGSMVGALLAGILYQKTARLPFAMLGEVFGTGILGAMLCYPVAKLLLGNVSAALFTFVVPFGISSLAGALLAAILVLALQKTHALERIFPNA